MPAPSENPSLDHVTITASDLAASLVFYDAALAPLGLRRVVDLLDEEDDEPVEAAAYGTGDTPLLWVVAGPQTTTHVHVALRTGSADAVRTFHDVALCCGGTSQIAPSGWPHALRGQLSATVVDPDGNLIEAVAPLA